MSKPNLLAFSTSIGFFRNKRVRELRSLLQKKVQSEVAFCELAPQLFSILMAYAGENQIDGDFSGYSPEQFQEIFAMNHRALTVKQTELVMAALHEVGLMDAGKIRSWKRYNRHLASYEQDKKAKIKAGKERQRRATEAAKNGKPLTAAEEYPEQSAANRPARSKEKIEWNGKLWAPTALQDLCKQIEKEIEAKKKSKPSVDAGASEADSHNICYI